MNKNKLDKAYPVISVYRENLTEMGFTEEEANNVSEEYMKYLAEYMREKINENMSENDVFWTALGEAIKELKKK